MPLRQVVKYVDIHKNSTFNFSRKVLIGQLNSMAMRELRHASRWQTIQFDSKNAILYQENFTKDTLAVLLDLEAVSSQDTIRSKSMF